MGRLSSSTNDATRQLTRIRHSRRRLRREQMAGFHGLDATGQVAVGVYQAAQLDEGTHDGNVDLDRALGAQHAGEHGDALLSESVGQRRPSPSVV